MLRREPQLTRGFCITYQDPAGERRQVYVGHGHFAPVCLGDVVTTTAGARTIGRYLLRNLDFAKEQIARDTS